MHRPNKLHSFLCSRADGAFLRIIWWTAGSESVQRISTITNKSEHTIWCQISKSYSGARLLRFEPCVATWTTNPTGPQWANFPTCTMRTKLFYSVSSVLLLISCILCKLAKRSQVAQIFTDSSAVLPASQFLSQQAEDNKRRRPHALDILAQNIDFAKLEDPSTRSWGTNHPTPKGFFVRKLDEHNLSNTLEDDEAEKVSLLPHPQPIFGEGPLTSLNFISGFSWFV